MGHLEMVGRCSPAPLVLSGPKPEHPLAPGRARTAPHRPPRNSDSQYPVLHGGTVPTAPALAESDLVAYVEQVLRECALRREGTAPRTEAG